MNDIIVALATAFDEDENINFKSLDKIIEHNIEQGADGFFIGGSAGEGLLLTLDEKISLMEYLSSYCTQYKMMMNVSSLSVKEALIIASKAQELNYSAISSMCPYFYQNTMESNALYFNTIMDEIDLPLIIYNFPINSGVTLDLEDEHINSLLKNPSLLGIKHTDRNLYDMEKIMRINPKLKIYNGYDELYLSALPLGIEGAIGSSFNITTSLFKNIGNLYFNGQIEEARKVQQRANIIMDSLIKVGLIPGLKHSLNYLGLEAGLPRKPFIPLTDESKKYLETVLDENLN